MSFTVKNKIVRPNENKTNVDYFKNIESLNENTVTLIQDIFLNKSIHEDNYDDAIHQFFFVVFKQKHIKSDSNTSQYSLYNEVDSFTFEKLKNEQVETMLPTEDVTSIKKIINDMINLNTKIQLSKGSENEFFKSFDLFSKSCVFNGFKIINDFQNINKEVYGLVFNTLNNMISRRCCILLDESVNSIIKLFVSYFVYYNIDNGRTFLKDVSNSEDVYKFFGMCFMVKNIHRKFDQLFRLDVKNFKDEISMNNDLKQRMFNLRYYDSIRPNKLILDYNALFKLIYTMCDLTLIDGFDAVKSAKSIDHFMRENFVMCLKCMDKIDVMFMYRMLYDITVTKYGTLKDNNIFKKQINSYFQNFVVYFNTLTQAEINKLSVAFWVSGMPLDFIYVVSQIDDQMKKKENASDVFLQDKHVNIDEYAESNQKSTQYKNSITHNRDIAVQLIRFKYLNEEINNRDISKRFALSSDIMVTCINRKFKDSILNQLCKKYSRVFMKNQLDKKSKETRFLSYGIKNFESLVEMNDAALESKKIDMTHIENANLLFNLLRKEGGYMEIKQDPLSERYNYETVPVFSLNFLRALIEKMNRSTQTKYSSDAAYTVKKENVCDRYIIKFHPSEHEKNKAFNVKNNQLVGISNTDMSTLLKDIRDTIDVDDETFNTVYHLMRYKYIIDDLVISIDKIDELYADMDSTIEIKKSIMVLLDRMSSQCDKTFQKCISNFLKNYMKNLYPENVLKTVMDDLKDMMISGSNETINNFISETNNEENEDYFFDVGEDYMFERTNNQSENSKNEEYMNSLGRKINSSEIESLQKLQSTITKNLNDDPNQPELQKRNIDSILRQTLKQQEIKQSNQKIDSVKRSITSVIHDQDFPLNNQIEEIQDLINTNKNDSIVEQIISENPKLSNEQLAIKSIEAVIDQPKKNQSQRNLSMKTNTSMRSMSQAKNLMNISNIKLTESQKMKAESILEKSLSDLKKQEDELKKPSQSVNVIDDEIQKVESVKMENVSKNPSQTLSNINNSKTVEFKRSSKSKSHSKSVTNDKKHVSKNIFDMDDDDEDVNNFFMTKKSKISNNPIEDSLQEETIDEEEEDGDYEDDENDEEEDDYSSDEEYDESDELSIE